MSIVVSNVCESGGGTLLMFLHTAAKLALNKT